MELTDPRCGKTWKQRGNTSGHCTGCHETFEGITLFDAHQRRDDESSKTICLDPAKMTVGGKPLRLIDRSWRGPEMPESAKTWKTA